MKDPYAEIELQMARTIDYLAALKDAGTIKEYADLHEQILQAVNARMDIIYSRFTDNQPESVTSSEVTLHVRDDKSGQIYIRKLPMDYEENNNGVTITGETLEGKETSLVFLSNEALKKITELTGRGSDTPRCQHDH